MTPLSTRFANAQIGEELACYDECNGPVVGRSRGHLAISHFAYWIWMRLPDLLAFSRIGHIILARAGDVIFSCTCRDKNDKAIAKALEATTDTEMGR